MDAWIVASALAGIAAAMVVGAALLDARERRIEAEWRNFDSQDLAASLIRIAGAANDTAMMLGAVLIPSLREMGIQVAEWVDRWESSRPRVLFRQRPGEPDIEWWHRMIDLQK